jgi:hypothetical protein
MLSIQALALFARLRWPDLTTATTEELNVRFGEVWSTLRHTLPSATSQRILSLDAAADVALLTAFIQVLDPSSLHYAAAVHSLQVYGLSRGEVETAAYTKVLALANRQDVHASITAAIERVPDLPRARPGRPRTGEEGKLTVETVKKHLDIARVIADQVEARSANFTGTVNDALALWLLIGDEEMAVEARTPPISVERDTEGKV